ncbi:MAG: hypothetical protein H0X25_23120 [Acidobacteriales bacterium]|nr:hypothetical protein [Terriglobales bacterium]
MNKSLIAFVVASAAACVGQTSAQPQAQPAGQAQAAQPSQPAQAGQPSQPAAAGQTTPAPAGQATAPAAAGQAAPAAQKKEIKDPAEYNAYVGAVQASDPNAKVSGLEAFLQSYPNSVMKVDALELLMASYQQTNNPTKMMDAAQRLLTADPNNLRALALMAYTKRAQAEANQNPQQNLTDAATFGQKGLDALKTAPKPDGMADADFDKLKGEMAAIFNGAVGINALQAKNYPQAQQSLRAAVDTQPADLRNVYPLALAYLTANPPDGPNGLFYVARAAALANGTPAQQQIEAYGKSQYTKYHGSDQGWTDLEATAKTATSPPAGLNITKYTPPTPADQAADLVKSKDPKDLSFAEWELVLSAGKQEDADKVWNAIKGKPLIMEGQLISGTPTSLQIAASQDDIDAKRADITLTMVDAIPARLMPKPGATVDIEGTPVSYTPNPFVMTMEKGSLVTKAPATPAKRSPAHKRPS